MGAALMFSSKTRTTKSGTRVRRGEIGQEQPAKVSSLLRSAPATVSLRTGFVFWFSSSLWSQGGPSNPHKKSRTMADVRYAFLTEWFDATAQLMRRFTLTFYASDNTVEMVRGPVDG